MNYFETSAKTNQNIVKAFASFSDQLCQKEYYFLIINGKFLFKNRKRKLK